MPPMRPVDVAVRQETESQTHETVFDIQGLQAGYGSNVAIKGVDLEIYRNVITAVIRLSRGIDLYGDGVEPVEVRRRIGMVFQKANPFPKTIYDNVAWAPRVLGLKKDLDERVEKALQSAALWDEVKDRLKRSALSLSGGQQQRLCIARAIAIEP